MLGPIVSGIFLASCGLEQPEHLAATQARSGDEAADDPMPNFHPLRPHAEMRGSVVNVGFGDKVSLAVADNRTGQVVLAFHPGMGPDFFTTRPEEARLYKVATGGLIADGSSQWADMNTGVVDITYSPKYNDFRVSGPSRRMDGSTRSGEIRSSLMGMPGNFNGNTAVLGFGYTSASSKTRDVFALSQLGVLSSFMIGEVDMRGVRVKTSLPLPLRNSDGCFEIGGMWTEGSYTFTALVGKRRTNNGQKDLLRGVLTYYNLAKDEELISSVFDVGVAEEEDVIPSLACIDYKFRVLGVFPELRRAMASESRPAAVVWRDQQSRQLPLVTYMTYWGTKDPMTTHTIPEETVAVAPYASDRWGALVLKHDRLRPMFHQVVFMILGTNGAVEDELVLTDDNVDPEYGLSKTSQLRNASLVNVGGNFFVASWVTKQLQVKVVAIAIVES